MNNSEHFLFSESSLLSLLYLSLWEHLLLASLNSNRSIKSVILEKKCYSHKLLFKAELPSSISYLAKFIYKQWGDYQKKVDQDSLTSVIHFFKVVILSVIPQSEQKNH